MQCSTWARGFSSCSFHSHRLLTPNLMLYTGVQMQAFMERAESEWSSLTELSDDEPDTHATDTQPKRLTTRTKCSRGRFMYLLFDQVEVPSTEGMDLSVFRAQTCLTLSFTRPGRPSISACPLIQDPFCSMQRCRRLPPNCAQECKTNNSGFRYGRCAFSTRNCRDEA